MREVAFIKQNKEKWLEIEQVIEGKIKKNPDDLSSMYINLVNDLSFAQTYYPKSKATLYINHLSTSVFQKIYKTRRIDKNRFLQFFLTEIPLVIYEYKRYLYYAFSFFFLFVCIGVLIFHYNKEFVSTILPPSYVNMTLENIKNGGAMDVYKGGSNWGSTIGIMFNNIMVGAKLYIFGIFGGVGSLYILLQNSIMLGVFQYLFYEHGALNDSLRGIWLHGTFEIFGMVIECMAGLVLGTSILFPKTFSRINSLKIGMKDSLKIFASTIPFTVVAAIIEGYVTRYALEMPEFLNLFIIFGCLITITFYYFIYPNIVHNKIKKQTLNGIL
ncbi:stage II sporulation protein M [Frigoriflavimonas asaccharolytica]|uniref:Putative membrane protein SpoIIM required for sporulation n=1 Tax=Frigoriflavimonas asaccharolytica TaxID=2735899 RepID=A0A8J8KCC7_9FLAO|nr:stage II sporulation protein M [Frigoriflavimonas asaccharolytica]NRS93484.1 putative membrane protein SpoIIM required for sporulation [Frigoriflavimonas asaccharolytica]